jgi:aryl-alcohol dehydrogenase-like predicted oxidoreductase
MKQRTLGRHGLTVSALGMGCMGLSQGYGAADDTESITTLHRAIEAGITFLDTAMSYGTGHNERLLGRALAGRREEVTLATKFGIVRGPDGVQLDARPEHVRRYCDASLARLGVDTIDLYYLHRIDPQVPVAETVGAMAELITAGKVRHLGLSEAGPDDLERAATVHPIAAVQFEWSLFWREPEDDVVPTARKLGIGLVPYSPLGRGLLAGSVSTGVLQAASKGDFRRDDPRFSGEHLERNLALAGELRQLAGQHGRTAAQLALAWLLAQGTDVVPIPGTRHAARVVENAAAVDLPLSSDDLARLEVSTGRDAWSGDRRSFAAYGTARTPSS